MNLFRLERFFQPLQNPAGFGIVDFLALAVAVFFVALFLIGPRVAPFIERFAAHTRWCMFALVALTVFLRLAILPVHPVPAPRAADDFSYLLLADTLAHFRMANPVHPMHRFFENVFTLQEPSWSSIYPLGQGLVLALGQVIFGTPWAGVVLSCAILSALVYWMLRAWTKPVWALAGGLLTVIQFGPLSTWMNLYWGGAVSAIAGCLIFGSLPRLHDSGARRYAALLGAGLGLQLLTRPYEFVFVAAAVALDAAFFVRRRALLLVVLLTLAPAGLFTLLQNQQVTGNWTTLPYITSRARYGIPTTFTFQPNPIPQGPLTLEQQIDYNAQSAIHGNTPETASLWLARLIKRAACYRFYFLAPLYLALPAFLISLRRRGYRFVAATLLLLACGTTFYPYFYPHYIAVATCLFVLISVKGLENLARLTVHGIPAGREAARLILAVCFAHFVFWYGLYASGDLNILRTVSPFESQYRIPVDDPDGRVAIENQLLHTSSQQLVFVRYRATHSGEPWIHNAADIDRSHTVWALDLGETENTRLLHYYPNRTAWLLDPDARPPRLTPYSAGQP